MRRGPDRVVLDHVERELAAEQRKDFCLKGLLTTLPKSQTDSIFGYRVRSARHVRVVGVDEEASRRSLDQL